jgi:hypothetical protein
VNESSSSVSDVDVGDFEDFQHHILISIMSVSIHWSRGREGMQGYRLQLLGSGYENQSFLWYGRWEKAQDFGTQVKCFGHLLTH